MLPPTVFLVVFVLVGFAKPTPAAPMAVKGLPPVSGPQAARIVVVAEHGPDAGDPPAEAVRRPVIWRIEAMSN
jgi:hypothetical protein